MRRSPRSATACGGRRSRDGRVPGPLGPGRRGAEADGGEAQERRGHGEPGGRGGEHRAAHGDRAAQRLVPWASVPLPSASALAWDMSALAFVYTREHEVRSVSLLMTDPDATAQMVRECFEVAGL